MRYECSDSRMAVSTYLEYQMSRNSLRLDMIDDGMVMLNMKGERIFCITNDGLVVVNLDLASIYDRTVSTFFRETLGKNMYVHYTRKNYTIVVYPEGGQWKEATKYRRTDMVNSTAVFDLRLTGLAGLRPLVKAKKPGEKRERKTVSKW